ncbi:MAG: hypothetical protein HDR71_10210 [Lachnospiraceae bacterium]|nr:hypothetical protein [Lachnospiraceae bacterium]
MLVVFLKHKYLLILIFSLLLLSIICQIVMGVILQKMIKEANNMAATENKLLKQCKLKYTNCYKLNGRMVNTSVFVDKFIQKMKFIHLPLTRLSHISGQLMMLSVLVTGITICLSLASGDTLFQIIPYYLISILGLYLYFSISGIVDIQGKKIILKTDMVDYLENHLIPRLEIEKENIMKEEDKKHETIPEPAGQVIPASAEYQEELEDLLKEFFA